MHLDPNNQPNVGDSSFTVAARCCLTLFRAEAYVAPVNPRCSFGEAVLGQRESAGPCFYPGRCA